MSDEAPGRSCWNCDEPVNKIVTVFLQASQGDPVTLLLCEPCYQTVYLPLVSSMATLSDGSEPPHTVLIVDDDPALRTFVSIALEEEGYRVHLAANGKEALTKVREAPPSAIVLDLFMPVMDGPDFLKELRRAVPAPTIPVLAISAFDGDVAVDALGVDAFLSKPFALDTLLGTVHTLVRGRG